MIESESYSKTIWPLQRERQISCQPLLELERIDANFLLNESAGLMLLGSGEEEEKEDVGDQLNLSLEPGSSDGTMIAHSIRHPPFFALVVLNVKTACLA